MSRTATRPLATYRVLAYLAAQPEGCATRRAILDAASDDPYGITTAWAGLAAAGYLTEIGRHDDPGWQLTERGFDWATDIQAAAS